MDDARWDVLVAGGGTSGIAAAVAASRAGARTLLVEQRPFVGGAATYGLPLLTFHDAHSRPVIGGIAQEFVDRLVEEGGSTGHVPTRGGHMKTYVNTDAEMVKYVALLLLEEAGVELLFHTFVCGVVCDSGRVRGVEVVNKDGHQRLRADLVVDTTGDADVCALAGAEMVKGREGDGAMQAMTLMFRLGNVDLARVAEVIGEGAAYGPRPGSEQPGFIRATGHFAPWREALVRAGIFPEVEEDRVFWVNSLRDGEVNVNAVRVVGLDGSSARDLTRAEIEGRKQAVRLARFFREHVPGFECSYLVSTAPQVGVRETRRIVGDYVLTGEDVVEGREFPDRVARTSYPVDIHDPSGKGWHAAFVRDGGSASIPYRCLLPRGLDGVLVAGRCASTTHEAHGSTRVMAVGMAMGQAAGIAAAMSAAGGLPTREVDVAKLQARLRSAGAILDAPAPVPAP